MNMIDISHQNISVQFSKRVMCYKKVKTHLGKLSINMVLVNLLSILSKVKVLDGCEREN